MSDQELDQEVNSYTEAPASWNIRYYMDGYDCMLTLRDMSGSTLLAKASAAINKLNELGASPNRNGSAQVQTQPAAPAPMPVQNVPAPQQEATVVPDEWIKVDSIAHAVTDSGHHYVKVKGGRFVKYGLKAWAESLPEVAAGYAQWNIGEEFIPHDGMEYALVSGGKKITRFNSVQA